MTRLSQAEFETILRLDVLSFAERVFYELNPQTPFERAPYIEVIAAKLEACQQGKIKRLGIAIGPRSMKSTLVSVAYVAWWLGHNPAARVVVVSYSQELADKLARDCRRVMLSSWYQRLFPTRLLPSRQAVHDFVTTMQGGRFATSVGGSITGFGGDLIIIDDIMKAADALSETIRKVTNQWYHSSLLTRLNNQETGCIRSWPKAASR